MTALQAWLVAGIPSLLLATIAFIGQSPWRSLVGYASLAAGFGVLATAHRASAAAFAVIIALLYASGRGGATEGQSQTSEEFPRTTSGQ